MPKIAPYARHPETVKIYEALGPLELRPSASGDGSDDEAILAIIKMYLYTYGVEVLSSVVARDTFLNLCVLFSMRLEMMIPKEERESMSDSTAPISKLLTLLACVAAQAETGAPDNAEPRKYERREDLQALYSIASNLKDGGEIFEAAGLDAGLIKTYETLQNTSEFMFTPTPDSASLAQDATFDYFLETGNINLLDTEARDTMLVTVTFVVSSLLDHFLAHKDSPAMRHYLAFLHVVCVSLGEIETMQTANEGS